MLGALVIGAVAIALTGKFYLAAGGMDRVFAAPTFTVPQWSIQAMIELVVPLTITVLVVQNGQGYAVLRQNGHNL